MKTIQNSKRENYLQNVLNIELALYYTNHNYKKPCLIVQRFKKYYKGTHVSTSFTTMHGIKWLPTPKTTWMHSSFLWEVILARNI